MDIIYGDLNKLIEQNYLKKIPKVLTIYSFSMFYGKYLFIPNLIQNEIGSILSEAQFSGANFFSPKNYLISNYNQKFDFLSKEMFLNFAKNSVILHLSFEILIHKLYQIKKSEFEFELIEFNFFDNFFVSKIIFTCYLKIIMSENFDEKKIDKIKISCKSIFIKVFSNITPTEIVSEHEFEIDSELVKGINKIINKKKVRFNDFEKKTGLEALLSKQNILFVFNINDAENLNSHFFVYFYLNHDITKKYIICDHKYKFYHPNGFIHEKITIFNYFIGKPKVNIGLYKTEDFWKIYLRLNENLFLEGDSEFLQVYEKDDISYLYSFEKENPNSVLISTSSILPIDRIIFKKIPKSRKDLFYSNFEVNKNKMIHQKSFYYVNNCLYETQEGICVECLDNYTLDWEKNECIFCNKIFSIFGKKCLEGNQLIISNNTSFLHFKETFYEFHDKKNSTPNLLYYDQDKEIEDLEKTFEGRVMLNLNSPVQSQFYISKINYYLNPNLLKNLPLNQKTVPFTIVGFYNHFGIQIADAIEENKIVFNINKFLTNSDENGNFEYLELPNYFPFKEFISSDSNMQNNYRYDRIISRIENDFYSANREQYINDIANIDGINHINMICNENDVFSLTGLYTSECIKDLMKIILVLGLPKIRYQTTCLKGCLSCKSRFECSKCEEGYFNISSNCIKCDEKCKNCEKFAFNCLEIKKEDTNQIFQNSNNNCLSTKHDECIQCKNGFYLIENKCSKCPLESFYDGKNCKNCSLNCLKCSSFYECSKCNMGYYLFNRKCQNCTENCLICFDEKLCLKCKNNYFFDKSFNKCIEKLQNENKYHLNNEKSNSEKKHLISFEDSLKYNKIPFCKSQIKNKCISCELEFYLLNNQCVNCKQNCIICENFEKCLFCKNGYILKILKDKTTNCEYKFDISLPKKYLNIVPTKSQNKFFKINLRNLNCSNCPICQNFGEVVCPSCEKCFNFIKPKIYFEEKIIFFNFSGYLNFDLSTNFKKSKIGWFKNPDSILKMFSENKKTFFQYFENEIRIFVNIEMDDIKDIRIFISNYNINNSESTQFLKLNNENQFIFEKGELIIQKEEKKDFSFNCKDKFIVDFEFEPLNISFYISNYIDRKTKIFFIINKKCFFQEDKFSENFEIIAMQASLNTINLFILNFASTLFLSLLNFKDLLDVVFFIKKIEYNDLNFIFKFLKPFDHSMGYDLMYLLRKIPLNLKKKLKIVEKNINFQKLESLTFFINKSAFIKNFSKDFDKFILPFLILFCFVGLYFILYLCEAFLKKIFSKKLFIKIEKKIRKFKEILYKIINYSIMLFYFDNMFLFYVSIPLVKFYNFNVLYFILIFVRSLIVTYPFFYIFDIFKFLKLDKKNLNKMSQNKKEEDAENSIMILNYLKNIMIFTLIFIHYKNTLSLLCFIFILQIFYVIKLISTKDIQRFDYIVMLTQEIYFILYFFITIDFMMNEDQISELIFTIVYITGISTSFFFFFSYSAIKIKEKITGL